MSLEVLLIPIGIAAVAAWREHQRSDLCEKCKATRITDQQVLVEALTGMNATDLTFEEGKITCAWQGHSLTFQRVGEVFLGRVDDATDDTTDMMLSALDTTLGSLAQNRNLSLARERAAALGLTLITEHVHEDGSVELVFEEAT